MKSQPQLESRSARRQPASGFDRVARVYRWAEYLLLGPLLSRTRSQLLDKVGDARHALVLGDGDGRFLAQLLHRQPGLQAVALDGSEAMLRLLRHRCAFAGSRLQTARTQLPHFPTGLELDRVDLVVTHFFLDCLSQAETDALCMVLGRVVAPGCRWLISDFAIPLRQPWRALGRAYIRLLYLAFRALTGLRAQALPEHATPLTASGFCRVHHQERLKGLLYSELWQRTP